MEAPSCKPQDPKDQPTTTKFQTSHRHPRMVNVSNESSLIPSGAFLDRTYSRTSPGCLIKLRSGEFGGQFGTLISFLPSMPSLNSFVSVNGHTLLLGRHCRQGVPMPGLGIFVWVIAFICIQNNVSQQYTGL